MKFHKHGALLLYWSGNVQMQTNWVTQDQLPLGWGVAFAELLALTAWFWWLHSILVPFLHHLCFVPKKCAPAMRCARQCPLPFLGAILQLHHFQAPFPSSQANNILQNCLKGHFSTKHFWSHFWLRDLHCTPLAPNRPQSQAVSRLKILNAWPQAQNASSLQKPVPKNSEVMTAMNQECWSYMFGSGATCFSSAVQIPFSISYNPCCTPY